MIFFNEQGGFGYGCLAYKDGSCVHKKQLYFTREGVSGLNQKKNTPILHKDFEVGQLKLCQPRKFAYLKDCLINQSCPVARFNPFEVIYQGSGCTGYEQTTQVQLKVNLFYDQGLGILVQALFFESYKNKKKPTILKTQGLLHNTKCS